MNPLYTKMRSKIWYSEYGVGKRAGTKFYVEKSYAHKVVPEEILSEGREIMKEFLPDFSYKVIVWDKKTRDLSFATSPNFDKRREPAVGKIAKINMNTFQQTKDILVTSSYYIYHHKWLFVENDYEGFDVEEAWEWSKLWLSKLYPSASADPITWKKQLRSIGLN